MNCTERIRTLVREIAPRDMPVLDAETRLVEDLGFDSVSLLELSVALEEEFNLPALEEASRRGVRRIGELESLVEELVARVESGV